MVEYNNTRRFYKHREMIREERERYRRAYVERDVIRAMRLIPLEMMIDMAQEEKHTE